MCSHKILDPQMRENTQCFYLSGPDLFHSIISLNLVRFTLLNESSTKQITDNNKVWQKCGAKRLCPDCPDGGEPSCTGISVNVPQKTLEIELPHDPAMLLQELQLPQPTYKCLLHACSQSPRHTISRGLCELRSG